MNPIFAAAPMLGSGFGEFTFNYSSNAVKPDIRALAVAAGWNGLAKVIVNISSPLINQIIIPDSVTAIYPSGLKLNFASNVLLGSDGMQGSLRVSQPVTVNNLGKMYGIGGTGGLGQGLTSSWSHSNGNSGRIYASGGSGGRATKFVYNTVNIQYSDYGNNGTTATAPSDPGGSFGGGGPNTITGGKGGYGGGWGAQGDPGNNGTATNWSKASVWYNAESGGLAGFCVEGNAWITWENTGDRQGRIQ